MAISTLSKIRLGQKLATVLPALARLKEKFARKMFAHMTVLFGSNMTK